MNYNILMSEHNMFKNLLFEIEKNNMELDDLAIIIDLPLRLLKEKLSGQKDFNLAECFEIQKVLRNLKLDYLFKK